MGNSERANYDMMMHGVQTGSTFFWALRRRAQRDVLKVLPQNVGKWHVFREQGRTWIRMLGKN